MLNIKNYWRQATWTVYILLATNDRNVKNLRQRVKRLYKTRA